MPPTTRAGGRFVLSGALALVPAAVFLFAAPPATRSPVLLVVNKAENTLTVVDPASGKALNRIATGDGPHEVALSEDGRTAFVTNYGAKTPGSSLSVIDLQTATETRRVDLGPLRRPHGIIVSGGVVYFTIEANRAVARYDPVANSVDWLMGTGEAGTHMVVATPDGSTLFTSNIGSNSVTVLARGGAGGQAWTVQRIPVGKGPEGIDITPDGAEVWTAHLGDGGVSIIDVAARKVVEVIDIGTKRSNRLRFTRDGRLVLVSDLEAGDLVVMDRATRKVVKRLPLGKGPSGILVTPDGSRAYVALTGENALVLVDLQKLEPLGRLATGEGPDGMAWRE